MFTPGQIRETDAVGDSLVHWCTFCSEYVDVDEYRNDHWEHDLL